MMKKWSPTAKTCILCNMKKDMKKNLDNVKLCNKNVIVVEKNFIKAQKYLTIRGSSPFID